MGRKHKWWQDFILLGGILISLAMMAWGVIFLLLHLFEGKAVYTFLKFFGSGLLALVTFVYLMGTTGVPCLIVEKNKPSPRENTEEKDDIAPTDYENRLDYDENFETLGFSFELGGVKDDY